MKNGDEGEKSKQGNQLLDLGFGFFFFFKHNALFVFLALKTSGECVESEE